MEEGLNASQNEMKPVYLVSVYLLVLEKKEGNCLHFLTRQYAV